MRHLITAALFVSAPVLGADPGTAHDHEGVLTPYPHPPPKPTISAEEQAQLREGKPVLKQIRSDVSGGAGGRGVAIQDIQATEEVVWSRITSFEKYPEWVDNVRVCETYSQSDDHTRTRFVVGAMLLSGEYYIDHVINPDEHWMTWTLDYERNSDLDDSVGYYRTEPHPDKPGWTRLYYSVDFQVKQWVPQAIQDMVAKQGLKKATEWVKRESEAAG
ncbi:MAG: SRPBCC family protein [Proteobacteria bacterium]|nr:SRPBCC family protein [Pseudomonadota bacterium]